MCLPARVRRASLERAGKHGLDDRSVDLDDLGGGMVFVQALDPVNDAERDPDGRVTNRGVPVAVGDVPILELDAVLEGPVALAVVEDHADPDILVRLLLGVVGDALDGFVRHSERGFRHLHVDFVIDELSRSKLDKHGLRHVRLAVAEYDSDHTHAHRVGGIMDLIDEHLNITVFHLYSIR